MTDFEFENDPLETELVLKVKRGTGLTDAYGIAASKFYIMFPDGEESHVWSGVWNDYDPAEEIAGALLEAAKRYAARFSQLAKDQSLPVENYREEGVLTKEFNTVRP